MTTRLPAVPGDTLQIAHRLYDAFAGHGGTAHSLGNAPLSTTYR